MKEAVQESKEMEQVRKYSLYNVFPYKRSFLSVDFDFGKSRLLFQTHSVLEKKMEKRFGVSNREAIRRAILRQKSRRAHADFDEATFNEDALTVRGKSILLLRNALRNLCNGK